MSDKVVLCFGDSNTWGAAPTDISRFPFSTRWPGRLSSILGSGWHVIEEGLPNRTTHFEDPLIPLRNGAEVFPMVLETHSPVDIAVVMLGTNDPKKRVGGSVANAVKGLQKIIQCALESGAKILVVAPPPMASPIKYDEFEEQVAIPYCRELTAQLGRLTNDLGIPFLDAGQVVSVSSSDGVHLDESAHDALAQAIAVAIRGE